MKDLLDNNKNISYITHGILLPIVGAIGFGGNLIGIGYVIFLECRQKHYTFYYLLLALFLFDLTFIASTTITFSFRELFPQLYEAPIPSEILYLEYFAFPMCYLTLFGSIYFTVAICFERYMAICLPLSYRTKKRSSLLYMCITFCFIIIVNIPHFYEVKIVEDENGKMDLYPSSLRNNRVYYFIYGVTFKFLFQYIIPYTTLVALNIKIWRVLRLRSVGNTQILSDHTSFRIHMGSNATHQRKMQAELGKLSLMMVILLLVCTPIGLINDIYEVYHGIQEVL